MLAFPAVVAAVTVIAVLGGLARDRVRPDGSGTATGSSAPTTPPVTASSAGATLGTASPPTSGPSIDRVVLVGAGDIADCASDGDSATAALLDGIAGTVFTLGDNAYESGTLEEYERCYGPTWGRHRDRTRPTPGNHEYGTGGAAGYFRYFGGLAGNPAEGWHAYDLGTWRIYALNSNCSEVACGEASAQVTWLKDDIAANLHRCTLAYWHHPRYSSGRHGSEPSTDSLWDVLYEAGTEIVLAGHDHTYERFAPMSDEGDPDGARGIVSFVVGTGGRRLYEFHDILPTSVVRNATTWGVLELTLSAGHWSTRFVPVAGGTFTDTASGTCH